MWVIKRTTDNRYYKSVPQSFEEGQVLLFVDDKRQAKPFNDEEKQAAILFRNEEWEQL